MVDPRRHPWSRPGLEGRRRCPASTNCSIHQPLALGAKQRAIGARGVVISGLDPIRISEIKLAQIAMQMRLGDVLVDTVDAALKDAEIPLGGVGVVGAEDEFLLAMVHYASISKVPSERRVDVGLVGLEAGVGMDVLSDDRADIGGGHVGDMEATHAAAALDQREDCLLLGGWLISPAATALRR